MDTTPIWTILEWFFYGIIRYIIFWIPYLTPPAVERGAPWQWWRYNGWSDWQHHDDNNGGPDEHWLQCWFRMIAGEAKLLVIEEAKDIVEVASDVLRGLIGTVRGGYASISEWLSVVSARLGWSLPSWASSAIGGLIWLYLKLPQTIRDGWQSWSDIWESIKYSVRAWARDRYDAFRDWADWAWDWVVDRGQTLWSWRDRIRGLIDSFVTDPYGFVVGLLGAAWLWVLSFFNNPYGYVTGLLGAAWGWLLAFRSSPVSWVVSWLGDTWSDLVAFRDGPLTFYYNLWSTSWELISDFVSDPFGFVIDHLEQAIIERW